MLSFLRTFLWLILVAMIAAVFFIPAARDWFARWEGSTLQREQTQSVNDDEFFSPTLFRASPESQTLQKKSPPLTVQDRAWLDQVAPMVLVAGGAFQMGNDLGDIADQRPVHDVILSPFLIDQSEVTNRQFQRFVSVTQYQTDAERRGWSFVFDTEKQEWLRVIGACWWNPRGNNFDGNAFSASINHILDFPAVHVSWNDAQAFCAWANKELPTESQWECAARGGLFGETYPWGNLRTLDGKEQANYWQGWFPRENLMHDGFAFLAPRKSFPPNGFGLYDMAGNAAEWCYDYYSANYYATSPKNNPIGILDAEAAATSAPTLYFTRLPSGDYEVCDENGIAKTYKRVVRGGSFLSAENRDQAYRVFHRTWQPQTLSYEDLGFRCIRNAVCNAGE